MQKGIIRQPNRSQQMRCKIFNNYARGSDPNRFWNTAECKYTLEVLLAGVSTKHATEQHRHLNRDKTQEIHRNSFRNFPLRDFNKHLPWFRCRAEEKKAKNHFSSRYNTLDICASLTCHFSLSSYAIFILSLSDNST